MMKKLFLFPAMLLTALLSRADDNGGITVVSAGETFYWSVSQVQRIDLTSPANVTVVGTDGSTLKSGLSTSSLKLDFTASNPGTTAAPPTFTRSGNTLAIATATAGATIHYTTDGTEPTEQSQAYSAPIVLTRNCTVKAIATAENLYPSTVATYVVSDFTVATPTFSRSGNTLTIGCETAEATIHYTTDGTEPTAESTAYTAPIELTNNCTVKAVAMRDGWNDSQVASIALSVRADDGSVVTVVSAGETFYWSVVQVQRIDLTSPANVTVVGIDGSTLKSGLSTTSLKLDFTARDPSTVTATPTFTRDGDTLAIATTTAGATIHYTTDGTEPTEQSQTYSAPIVLTRNCTVKAIATAENLYPSTVATYVVSDFTVATPAITVCVTTWGNVAPYLYVWTEDGNELNGSWPGSKMTASSVNTETGTLWWTQTIETDELNIIFNNGAEGYDNLQTSDIVGLTEGTHYFYYNGRDSYRSVGDDYVNSDSTAYSFASGGKYIFKNVGSGRYLGPANLWGTQASLIESSHYNTVHYVSDGVYTIESQVSNGGTNYYFTGSYMDGAAANVTISKLDNGNYLMSNGNTYYGYDGSSYVLANNLTDKTDDNVQWQIISYDDALAGATADNPIDATYRILCANFDRNHRYSDAWVMEASNQNLAGGAVENMCAESYHSTFTLSQQLADAPVGLYALTAQGFYRQDNGLTEDLPVFYANEETAEFPARTGSEDSMEKASASFLEGKYAIEPIFVQVTEDGQLTVGVKGTATNQWVIWDNFQLKYYGAEAGINDVKLVALKARLQQIIDSGEIEVEAENTKLTNVLSDINSTDISSAEAAENAINLLDAAIKEAQGYIKAKNVLPQMKKLTEETNFYTEESYRNYYGQWYEKYETATLTAVEANALQDPFAVTRWHSSNNADNLLMSAWDAEPMDWTKYCVNTWSIEGETDGSDFKIPFIEYWTSDDNSLGENVLTGTITGLKPGTYDVSALVRVRGHNYFNAPAYGITMQACDGEAVSAVAATAVDNTNFFVGQINTIGEVSEDGVLTLKFNIAADNNISWLSFKNVKFERRREFITESITAFSSPSFTATLNANGGAAQYTSGSHYRLGGGGSLTLTGKGNVDNIVSVKMNLQDPARSGSDVTVSSGTIIGDSIADVNATMLTITANGSWPQLWLSSLTVTYEGTEPAGTYAIHLPQYTAYGTVTSSKDWADEGDLVTLTATADAGCHLSRLYANRGAVTLTSAAADGQYSFTMPAEDVTIGAVFAEGGIATGVLLNVPEDDGTVAAGKTPIYNLQGQRLRQLRRGLNIIGGKKAVVR